MWNSLDVILTNGRGLCTGLRWRVSESEQKKLAVVDKREFQRTAWQVEPIHIGCILTNQTVDKYVATSKPRLISKTTFTHKHVEKTTQD